MRPQSTHRNSAPRKVKTLVGLPVVMATLVGLGACSNPEPQATEEDASTYSEEVAEKPESLEILTDNPELYLGQTLTVVGEVVETYDSRAFILREEEYFAADEGVLIVLRDETAPLPSPGEYVELSGEVQQFVVTDLEKDYEIALDNTVVEEIEATFAESTFLLADEIKYAQESPSE
ncbi:hypothetical protein [Leptolyngbya iicbica]|uniref:Uncharacterized protein n=2 Tax=Cyanophyceae TaxID=3028117 RepID=A0A4Q7E9B9_9CYAN|nr:hypothetical protein [Leptolyngbya sp. LK]RZM79212.1 hypothetical protein DYY88_10685 [Leptolyngbya sp. LK]